MNGELSYQHSYHCSYNNFNVDCRLMIIALTSYTKILPGPEDARICFTFFLTTPRNFNELQRSILLIMIICEIPLFIRRSCLSSLLTYISV